MPETRLIDSHCHLDFEIFDNDRQQVIQRANNNDVYDFVIPGTEETRWDRIKKLCTENKNMHACYGLHPYWVTNKKQTVLHQLDEYIDSNKPVALGECGLDFRPQQADKKTQLNFFEAQLSIALNNQLPVVIHSVKATETVIQSIKKYPGLHGMVHSFSGSLMQAEQLIALNFFISIGGSITFDNAVKIKKTAKKIPLSALLLETDAPDQSDQKNQNHRNEPAFLINTLESISSLRNEAKESIAQQTTLNAKSLFRL